MNGGKTSYHDVHLTDHRRERIASYANSCMADRCIHWPFADLPCTYDPEKSAAGLLCAADRNR